MRSPSEEHLRLLAIFHWVLAGFSLLFCAFPLLYVGVGVWFIHSPPVASGRGPPPPPAFGWIFVVIGLIFFALAAAYTAALVLSARALAARRRWLLVIVTAALSCALFPFGTALGVFTFIVLLRPDVQALFGRPPPQSAYPPWAGAPPGWPGPPPAWPPPQGWPPPGPGGGPRSRRGW